MAALLFRLPCEFERSEQNVLAVAMRFSSIPHVNNMCRRDMGSIAAAVDSVAARTIEGVDSLPERAFAAPW